MRYTTRVTQKNDSVLTFADMLDATKKLSPDPIKEIKVGVDLYEKLLTSVKDDMGKQKEKIYLGSLFGVKILIDPELKKNEYKIVQSK